MVQIVDTKDNYDITKRMETFEEYLRRNNLELATRDVWPKLARRARSNITALKDCSYFVLVTDETLSTLGISFEINKFSFDRNDLFIPSAIVYREVQYEKYPIRLGRVYGLKDDKLAI